MAKPKASSTNSKKTKAKKNTKKRLKKLTKAEISKLSEAIIQPSADHRSNSSQELANTILEEVKALPQLLLFAERKHFLDIVDSECKEAFVSLLDGLCVQYSTLYRSFRGKDGYIDLQIQ